GDINGTFARGGVVGGLHIDSLHLCASYAHMTVLSIHARLEAPAAKGCDPRSGLHGKSTRVSRALIEKGRRLALPQRERVESRLSRTMRFLAASTCSQIPNRRLHRCAPLTRCSPRSLFFPCRFSLQLPGTCARWLTVSMSGTTRPIPSRPAVWGITASTRASPTTE